MNPTTRLIVSYWNPQDPARRKEIDACVRRNVDNPEIDEVILLTDPGTVALDFGPKARYVPASQPFPTFGELRRIANCAITSPHDISIIGNTDCTYDGLEKMKSLETRQYVFCLTRKDVTPDWVRTEKPLCFAGHDSWIFTGYIRPLKWDAFQLGHIYCDWYLNWLLRHAGYMLANPCNDIPLYHLHASNERDYGPPVTPPRELCIGRVTEVRFTPLSTLTFPKSCQTGIISYSLYGDKPMYVHGALINAEMVRFVYPGFIARFYVDDTVSLLVKKRLTELCAEVIERPTGRGADGMIWRMEALQERGVDFVLIRDVDSRLSRRDRFMFDRWVETDRDYHLVRDHPYHTNPVILCMFNSRRAFTLPPLPTEKQLAYQDDERWFGESVMPLIQHSVAVHDTFHTGTPIPGSLVLPSVPYADDWSYFCGAKTWPDSCGVLKHLPPTITLHPHGANKTPDAVIPPNRKTRLLISYWNPEDETRRNEVDSCVRKNAADPEIDQILLVVDPGTEVPDFGGKIVRIEPSESRPRVAELLAIANEHVATTHDITILANADCWIRDLGKMKRYETRPYVFALSRQPSNELWEIIKHPYEPRYDGHEAWIFTGHIRPIKWDDFRMGVRHCDNIFNWLLQHAGYLLVNPCNDMTPMHRHASSERNYPFPDLIPPAGVGELASLPPVPLEDIAFPATCQTGIVAYSLFGNKPMYVHGAIINAKMCRFIYPGFIPRFYVDESVSQAVRQSLTDLCAEVIDMPKSNGTEGTLWRLLALEERGVDFVLIRDADSRLSRRDREFFDQWIASGKNWHVVRDSPFHVRPVILSMFNSRHPIKLPPLPFTKTGAYGVDEIFFRDHVLPDLTHSLAVHDLFDTGGLIDGAELLPSPGYGKDWNYFCGAKVWPDSCAVLKDIYRTLLHKKREG